MESLGQEGLEQEGGAFGAGGGLHTLYDRARSGRPPKLSEGLRRVLVWLLKQPPDAFGYASVGWTTALLRQALATWMGVHVSDDTLRRPGRRTSTRWIISGGT